MALTKADMADRLFEELGLNKREAKELVEMFFEQIRDSLADNRPVKLSGFGNFDLRDKSERPGRNPKTGEETVVFTCFNQDQALDSVDFGCLRARLSQNTVQEKLTAAWIAKELKALGLQD